MASFRKYHLFLVIIIFFIILSLRLFQLQFLQGEMHAQKADSRKLRLEFTKARRGSILDRKGIVLSQDAGIFHLMVLPQEVEPPLFLMLILGQRKDITQKLFLHMADPEKYSYPFSLGVLSHLWAGRVLQAVKKNPDQFPGLKMELMEDGVELILSKDFFTTRRKNFETLSSLLQIPEIELEKKWYEIWKKILKEENAFERKAFLASFQMFFQDIPLETAQKIEVAELKGFYITTESRRVYPYWRETWHFLGYVGNFNPQEFLTLKKEKKFLDLFQNKNNNIESVRGLLETGYFSDEKVGRRGLEKTFEKKLKGKKGVRLLEKSYRDHSPHILSQIPARAGEDLHLTIDFSLQKSLLQSFDHLEQEVQKGGIRTVYGHVSGAGVVINPVTGEILCLLSYPTAGSPWKKLSPNFHRALSARYPPGSIFKPISAVAFFESKEGAYPPVENGSWPLSIDIEVCCEGKLRDSRFFKCLGIHGETEIRRALQKSCNIFFYHFGEKLGGEQLAWWCNQFGLERPTGVELPGEKGGTIPSPAWKKKRFPRGPAWMPGDSRNFAIGQGYLTITPLGITRAIAAIFNGGKVLKLHILEKEKIEVENEISLSPTTLKAIYEGMRRVVQPGGTAEKSGLESFLMVAKTGSAQDGRGLNYAWISGVAWGKAKEGEEIDFSQGKPSREPKIAFSIVVENTSGHGGDTAGPIAAALLKIFFQNEKDK